MPTSPPMTPAPMTPDQKLEALMPTPITDKQLDAAIDALDNMRVPDTRTGCEIMDAIIGLEELREIRRRPAPTAPGEPDLTLHWNKQAADSLHPLMQDLNGKVSIAYTGYAELLQEISAALRERDALREQLAGVRNALRICYEQANEAMYAEYAGPHIGLIQDTCKAASAALPASADEGEGQ